MSRFDEHDPEPEFAEVAARLRAERPDPTALELDELRRRIHARAERGSRGKHQRRGMFMKSRMAITMMLVLGLMLSTVGAGLAVTGVSETGDAGVVQYAQEQPSTSPTLQTQAQTQTPAAVQAAPAPQAPAVEEQPTNEVLDETVESPAPAQEAAPAKEAAPAAAPAQAPRQAVAAEQVADELPFTGFAAVPVLLAGLALLVTGATMRRRSRADGN
jgi:cytoskeletal protein RodZ